MFLTWPRSAIISQGLGKREYLRKRKRDYRQGRDRDHENRILSVVGGIHHPQGAAIFVDREEGERKAYCQEDDIAGGRGGGS